MKNKKHLFALCGLAGLLLQGCIAFPPLIQVEHKDVNGNQEIMRRLDSIDQRLTQLEQKNAK
jgi:starvation-inducible outer membrane lipoprotein